MEYDYYIDETVTRQEKDHKGRITKLYRCGCKLCEKCWFNPGTGQCLYGGPFSSYVKEEDV